MTYEVTQSAFWTVRKEDEKVALVSQACVPVTAAISGQKRSDQIMKQSSILNVIYGPRFLLCLGLDNIQM